MAPLTKSKETFNNSSDKSLKGGMVKGIFSSHEQLPQIGLNLNYQNQNKRYNDDNQRSSPNLDKISEI